MKTSYQLEEAVNELYIGNLPIEPFHWEIEFPEVFGRENGGFDAMVGNPPFAGKNTLINSHRDGYLDWLKTVHEESHGNADLVAHFYRRAFNLLRPGRMFRVDCHEHHRPGRHAIHGSAVDLHARWDIFAARRRYRWPGVAAVVVSVVHVWRGHMRGPFILDGRNVSSDYSVPLSCWRARRPRQTESQCGQEFHWKLRPRYGVHVRRHGHIGSSNPISLMHELIAKDPRNAERIFPYLGGEEVNNSPEHPHHRYVVNFADFPLRREDQGASWTSASGRQCTNWLRSGIVPLDYPEPVAADWPALLEIVEER